MKYVEGARVVEAGRIGQPPRLGRKLDDVLFALRVDYVVAQAPAGHERGVLGDVAGALQKLARGEMAMHKGAAEDVDIPRADRGARLEIGAKHVERSDRAR